MNLRTAFTLSLTGLTAITGNFTAAKAQVVDTSEIRPSYCDPYAEAMSANKIAFALLRRMKQNIDTDPNYPIREDAQKYVAHNALSQQLFISAFRSYQSAPLRLNIDEYWRRQSLSPAAAANEIERICSLG